MRPLKRLHFHHVVFQAPEFARRRDGFLRKATPDRFERLGIHAGRLGQFNAQRIEFVRRSAPTNSEFETAPTQMIENADLLEQTRGMIDRQQVNQRTKPQSPGPLRQSRHPDARRRGHAQRGAVVLAHVEAVETHAVVEFGERQPVFVLLRQRKAGAVVLIENTKFHDEHPC